VRAQHTLITEHLGISHARAVLGWSMGAGQTYEWATSYPDFMDICVPFCGSAKTSLHNKVFLEGVKSALLAAKKHTSAGSSQGSNLPKGEEYRTWTEEEKEAGLKAFGRVYAGWGFSQAFYREHLYETALGYKDLEDFMKNFWESWALSKGMTNVTKQRDEELMPCRSRKLAGDALYLAIWGLLKPGTVQRQLQSCHASYQSKNARFARKDRLVFSVSRHEA